MRKAMTTKEAVCLSLSHSGEAVREEGSTLWEARKSENARLQPTPPSRFPSLTRDAPSRPVSHRACTASAAMVHTTRSRNDRGMSLEIFHTASARERRVVAAVLVLGGAASISASMAANDIFASPPLSLPLRPKRATVVTTPPRPLPRRWWWHRPSPRSPRDDDPTRLLKDAENEVDGTDMVAHACGDISAVLLSWRQKRNE